ncbi:hypothetical protein L1049_011291 [Liquidambar formosana]|uniref:Uncharacterized protein n=1 Tax=Liquidambar formosana TaxID=63359 RepID=A0AAP0RRY2_LIQFO
MDKINIYLNYKGVRILRGDAKGFKMERNKNHSLNANLLSMGGNGTEYYPVKNAMVNAMEKDRKSGVVSFSMVMEMRTNFDVDGVVNREYYASGACEGLKVGFQTATTRSGMFVNGNDTFIQTLELKRSVVIKLSVPNEATKESKNHEETKEELKA